MENERLLIDFLKFTFKEWKFPKADEEYYANLARKYLKSINSGLNEAQAVRHNEQTKEVCKHSYETYNTALGIYQTCRNCGHTRG